MKRINPSLQAVYLNLLQAATSEPPTSVARFSTHGHSYVSVRERHGAIQSTRSLGRADDPDVQEEAERLKREAEGHKARRSLVALLRRAGIPHPQMNMGRAIEVLANVGLFENGGVVLVGTAAYVAYSAALGVTLPSGLAATQDVDLSVVPLVVNRQPPVDLLEVLRRADKTFAPERDLLKPDAAPSKFKASDGLLVEAITSSRRNDDSPVPVPQLAASAEALRYQEYLVEGPERVVLLHGSGVPVLVPSPPRYGVHKLLVAGLRPVTESARRQKDLDQAGALRDALRVVNPDAWDDALEEARSRGRKWRDLIDRGLRALAD